jgi:hypothetical protein
VTRGEPRLVHITMITTCRVSGSRQYYTWTSRSFPRIPLEGLKTRLAVESRFFPSRGTWAVAVVRLSRPTEKHTTRSSTRSPLAGRPRPNRVGSCRQGCSHRMGWPLGNVSIMRPGANTGNVTMLRLFYAA